jgi:hypothetical protein
MVVVGGWMGVFCWQMLGVWVLDGFWVYLLVGDFWTFESLSYFKKRNTMPVL